MFDSKPQAFGENRVPTNVRKARIAYLANAYQMAELLQGDDDEPVSPFDEGRLVMDPSQVGELGKRDKGDSDPIPEVVETHPLEGCFEVVDIELLDPSDEGWQPAELGM